MGTEGTGGTPGEARAQALGYQPQCLRVAEEQLSCQSSRDPMASYNEHLSLCNQSAQNQDFMFRPQVGQQVLEQAYREMTGSPKDG